MQVCRSASEGLELNPCILYGLFDSVSCFVLEVQPFPDFWANTARSDFSMLMHEEQVTDVSDGAVTVDAV